MGKAKNHTFLILAVLFSLNILAWLAVYDLSGSELEIVFFDIGQGDAIFIETPQRHHILIDGGPSSIISEKLAREMPFWDRTIDLIILTHPEKDHLSGLIEVLKRYKVENVLWTGIVRNTSEYQAWLKLIKEEGSNVFEAKAGLGIKAGRAALDVLYPFENLAGREFENSNDTSIVNRLIFGENSFLFTGDISQSVETELADDLDSDILKVSHHGSKTSTAKEFVEAVSPKIAVISSGRNNSYGHPHQETLETLADYDINVLRTDELGDIKIISDGKNYAVSFIQD